MQYLSSEYIEFNLVGQEENDHNITCKLRGGNALFLIYNRFCYLWRHTLKGSGASFN